MGETYQLDPGVDADRDGIHRLHVVPPVSGDVKHLKTEKKTSKKRITPLFNIKCNWSP